MRKKAAKGYEVTFQGGVNGLPYRRWHNDLAQARLEATAVLAQLPNRNAHPAIIYGPGLGRDGLTVP